MLWIKDQGDSLDEGGSLGREETGREGPGALKRLERAGVVKEVSVCRLEVGGESLAWSELSASEWGSWCAELSDVNGRGCGA